MATKGPTVAKKTFIWAGEEGVGFPLGISFAFTDGLPPLRCLNADVNEEITEYLIAHGIKQKVGDDYSGVKGDVAAAREAATSVWEQLVSGEWTGEREAAGPMPSMVGDAVCRVLIAAGKLDGNDAAAVAAKKNSYMGKDTKAKRDGALKNPAVKLAFEEIKAEKAQARVEEARKAMSAADGTATPTETL